MDHYSELRTFKPDRDYFVGIDSDGCVFDSMEVKQKEFFIPLALKYFNLFSVSKIIRETWEFVNLYSRYRGGNRFTSLIKVFELLSEREEVKNAGIVLPDLSSLKKWTEAESKLGNATLRKYFETNRDASLAQVVTWSEAVNREIAEWLHGIAPFGNAKKAIEEISLFSDIIVVSQTPFEAIEKEWLENGIHKYARMIAAQEHGSKTEHIALAAKGKYHDNRILLIGDAFGDLQAAKNNNILFYPILPGREDKSWGSLLEEGLTRFKNGTFSGRYEDSLIKEFRKCLPAAPPWKTSVS